VVRDNGGHMVALKWTMQNHYGIDPGETFWAASDVGWVVGHSYICYAPLLHGCTSILYEGKPSARPIAGAVLAGDRRAQGVGDVHGAHRLPRHQEGRPQGRADRPLRPARLPQPCSWLASAPIPETSSGRDQPVGAVYDHWWQTETGWPICGNPVGLGALPVKYRLDRPCRCRAKTCRCWMRPAIPSSRARPARSPSSCRLPPSCLPTLWNNDARFRRAILSEFPGYYTTSDAGYIDADGYAYVMARTDDVINVAGHRLSTGPDGRGGRQAQGRRRMRGGRRRPTT
jgi:propionyl-CoA synthetase